MESMVKKIIDYQKGNENAAEEIIDKMTPLLAKYAFKLNYEDAKQDLQLFLLILIKEMKVDKMRDISDAAIVSYIKNAVRHEYIKIAKEKARYNENVYTDFEEEPILMNIEYYDNYMHILFEDLLDILTENEKTVIIGIYFDDLSVKDLSVKMNMTSWNIYKLKKSAINKMRDELEK